MVHESLRRRPDQPVQLSPQRRNPDRAATRRAVNARNNGLRRISSVTRWTLAGAVGLSGALALIAANAFHGRTIQNNPSSSSSQSGAAASQTTPAQTTPAQGQTDQSGLQAPAQAPVQTPAPPVVVSGGS